MRTCQIFPPDSVYSWRVDLNGNTVASYNASAMFSYTFTTAGEHTVYLRVESVVMRLSHSVTKTAESEYCLYMYIIYMYSL